MIQLKKAFEELFNGNRSFPVISSVMEYFDSKKDVELEQLQEDKWSSVLSDEQVPKTDMKHVFYKLKYQILLEKTQRQKYLINRISRIAAVILFPVLILFAVYYFGDYSANNDQLSQTELICPNGARIHYELPDGSNVWLAGGTVMKYDRDFVESRNVSIDGEAYFEVKRDESHPFKVNMQDLNVKVLGTKFNVLNYKDESISEVVVVSGLVEVSGVTKKFTEQLSKDKSIQLDKKRNKVSLSNINAQSYTAWIDGRLEFDNENIESVCRKIKRYYDIDVELNKIGLENNLFRANVKIGSIEELLSYMSSALPIKYELKDAKYINGQEISKRKLIISKR